jgi:putative oxidoreductase
MKKLTNLLRRGYELLVAGGAVLQSPFLLALRLYFFWQLFLTGKGKLENIGKVTEFFASLGIPLPTLNAYFIGSLECFGSLLLIIGLASRPLSLLIVISMTVAYLTADFEAVSNIFSDPDKFVKADPFPFLLTALIVLVFGPGRFSVDALLKWRARKLAEERRIARDPNRAHTKPSDAKG